MTTNLTKSGTEKERTRDVLVEERISFDSLLLSESTLSGLKIYGFQKPSPIQLKAIPLGRCGFDLIVKSKSGTGKTAVFAIIALEMINCKKNSLQVLVIAPTREIASQGCEVIKSLGANYKDLKVARFIGGLSVDDDIENARNSHIAVGTPGRIKHLINGGHLKTDGVRLFVLDEADKLVESAYQADINEIYNKLPKRKQILALSATYPDELDQFLAKYMLTPTYVSPEMDSPLLLGLKQLVSVVKPSLNVMQQMDVKIQQIVEVFSKVSFSQCLIFSNFQTRAESVSNILTRKGWASGFISGAQTQEERLNALKDLKEYKCRILLSTDLTARGIDAANVDLVINYDVPHDASTYLHRMGRAGRYGSRGICITIAAKGKEVVQLQNIIGMIGGKDLSIAQMPEVIPSDIWEADFSKFKQIQGTIPEGLTEETMKLQSIKSSILELKNRKFKETNESQSTAEADITKDTPILDNPSTEDILKLLVEGAPPPTPQKQVEINDKFKGIDVDQLLVGEFTESSTEIEREENETDINNIDLLKLLIERAPLPSLQKHNEINEKLKGIDAAQLLFEDFTDSSTKRKRVEKKPSTTTVDMPQGKRRAADSSSICAKNISLLNVSKLLVNDDFADIQSDISENIGSYLNKLKNEDCETIESPQDSENDEKTVLKDFQETFAETLPENVSQPHNVNLNTTSDDDDNLSMRTDKYQETSLSIESQDVPSITASHLKDLNSKEDIFMYAYDYAIDSSKPHWSELVDCNEESACEEVEKTEVNLLGCSDDSEQDDDEEMFHPRHKSRHRKKSWTKRRNVPVDTICTVQSPIESYNEPVTTQAKSHDVEYANGSTFNSTFENCSTNLMEHVDDFDDVDEFNAWFPKWQQQVQSVRDYVQQNIYLQEMNYYQYYK